MPRSTAEQRGRAAEGGGPFKRGGDGTMAIITLALEVTPGPLRFHLGRGRGMARFLAGEGREGAGGEGRPGPARRRMRPPAPEGQCGAGTGAAAGPRRFLPPPLKVWGGPGRGWV